MFGLILQQSFRRQQRRKILAGLAIAAGMAAATSMLALRVNLGDDLQAELRHMGANLVVTPAADSLPLTVGGVDLRPAGSGALLDESSLPMIKTVFWANNITAFAPILDVPVQIEGRHVILEGTYFDHPLVVPGSGETIDTGMRRLHPDWQINGRWPGDGSNQVLVGAGLARAMGIRPGQSLLLGTRPVTASGILRTGAAEDGELVAPLALAQQIAGKPGKFRNVLVAAVTKPEDAFARRDPAAMNKADAERWMCSPYAVSIAAELRAAIPGSAAHVVRPVAQSESLILRQLRLLIWFITAAALLAGGLALAAAMTAAVSERRGEIGLMKTMGASEGLIARLFLAEALLLALGGGMAGFALGEWVAIRAGVSVLGHGLSWKPALIPLVLLLAAAVALAASWWPVRSAMRLDPVRILRSES